MVCVTTAGTPTPLPILSFNPFQNCGDVAYRPAVATVGGAPTRSWATSASAGQRWPRRARSTRRCWPLRPVRSSWWAQPSRDVAKLASVTELKPTGADAGQQTLITEPVAEEIDSAEGADTVEEVTAPVESTPVEIARGGSHQKPRTQRRATQLRMSQRLRHEAPSKEA